MTEAQRTTRVAIIGGGIMGAAAQFQLAENGWTDTILFEKAELTSGSTGHAAGQIAHAVGSRIMGWINKTSIETYKRAEGETGQSIGWHEVGGSQDRHHKRRGRLAEVDYGRRQASRPADGAGRAGGDHTGKPVLQGR